MSLVADALAYTGLAAKIDGVGFCHQMVRIAAQRLMTQMADLQTCGENFYIIM